jgi:hypothetical protein
MWNLISRAEFKRREVERWNRVPHGLPVHVQLVVCLNDVPKVNLEGQVWLDSLGMSAASEQADAHRHQYPEEEASVIGSGL